MYQTLLRRLNRSLTVPDLILRFINHCLLRLNLADVGLYSTIICFNSIGDSSLHCVIWNWRNEVSNERLNLWYSRGIRRASRCISNPLGCRHSARRGALVVWVTGSPRAVKTSSTESRTAETWTAALDRISLYTVRLSSLSCIAQKKKKLLTWVDEAKRKIADDDLYSPAISRKSAPLYQL